MPAEHAQEPVFVQGRVRIADRLGETLSGGERRRTEIARALATRPRFILLDEPFAGVDPISVLDLQVTIQQLSKLGIGVLVTDHNVRDTLKICHRTYIVNEGSIIAEAPPRPSSTTSRCRRSISVAASVSSRDFSPLPAYI